MNINTPVENPNIPANLTKEITAVRNQITVGESEVKRLSGLASGLKYEISEALKQKTEIEASIKVLTETKKLYQSDILDLTNVKIALTNENKAIEKASLEKTASLAEREEAVRVLETELVDKRADLNSDFDDFTSIKDEFEKNKAVFDARVEKLNKALS